MIVHAFIHVCVYVSIYVAMCECTCVCCVTVKQQQILPMKTKCINLVNVFSQQLVFAPVHYFLIRTWWPWCTRLWRENSLGYPITSTTILESSSEGENSLSYPITSTTILDANTEMSKPPAIVAILQNLPLQISIALISILPCTI